MFNSNIHIASNIYVRQDPDIRRDKSYTKKITGAKLLNELRQKYFGLESIALTNVQKQIVSGYQICSYAKSGEISFGPVMTDSGLYWQCRCEYTACPGIHGCVPRTVHRESIPEEDARETESLQNFFEDHGIVIHDATIVVKKDKNLAEVEESPKEYAAPTEQTVEEIQKTSKHYTEITAPDCIISAPLQSHILLNSGPGTGKTYTIIQRLIYILANDLCPADEIYILCYTRSAKKIIENKISRAVVDGKIQPSANNICVLTFDSYASYFLMAMKEQGVITENFENADYNERIKLFNKYVSAEDFEGISYFIVDEIQDLVNERAEMVLKILKNLTSGYLLAGDRCQSIYDYEADDDATLDSVKFYELAEQQFPDDMLRYEITVNRRQSPDLAEESKKMRYILQNKSFREQNEYADEVMLRYLQNKKIEQYIETLTQTETVSTAILCRTNGEAEYISGLLCEKGIPHILNRGVNNAVPLPRWIADVLWDQCLDTISKGNFIKRLSFRTDLHSDPEMIWELLCRLTDSQDTAVLSIPALTTALKNPNMLPSEFYDAAPLLTVSTIHKAKGSEFDNVIFVESRMKPSSDSAEEARVRYVALTRPKSKFIVMKRSAKYYKRIRSGRVIEIGQHKRYQKTSRFCKSITIGLTGDVDINSFVSGDFETILDLQEYIAYTVKLYDKLTAKRSPVTGSYEILHNGRCIGTLSEKMTQELNNGVRATDYKFNLPDRLESFYVSGITTELLKQFSPKVPIEYQRSGICYGIQITGLARLQFKTEE